MGDLELTVEPIAAPAIAENDKIDGVLKPTGYRILVQILPPEETLERFRNSGLHMSDESRDREWQAQMWARVLDMGPECYQDEKRFPDKKPWCQAGDCIVMRPYSGTRFMVRGHLYALINDDTVQAVVAMPGVLERP